MKVLIVVDFQNDFCTPNGKLFVPGSNKSEYLRAINEAVSSYDHVVFTQDSHPEDHSSFEPHGGRWPIHCVAGSWGWAFSNQIDHHLASVVIRKGYRKGHDSYSAFQDEGGEPTGLSGWLSEKLEGHDGLIVPHEVHVCGLAYDYCVKATAIDAAAHHGFDTHVLRDLCRSIDPVTEKQATEEMLASGVHLS
jgi:nicotinamidase-related amidase